MNIRELISNHRTKIIIRLVLVLTLVISTSFVGSAYLSRHESVDGPTTNTDVGDRIAGVSNGTTIITTQGSIPSVELPRSAITEPNGAIYAINSSGTLIYRNTTYHAYFDVDPVPNTTSNVLYVAHEYVPKNECETKYPCYIRHIEIANLTTGEIRTIYTSKVSGPANGNAGRWHDVDRYDEDSILIADIETDSVIIVNTTSGMVEWQWRAERAFSPASGGEYTQDWTHINDVELLPDGRIMADLRNQDVVIFLDPDTGLQEEWTLGEDDNYEILNGQHNPDYIPESQGGPAVIVADSRNNRIAEYQRVNGSWEQSWVWQDSQMNWPRDADRLPNGNTLITDSGSNRVFEINQKGEIIWRVTADNPYEAERLDTGDESQGGESATRLGLESRTVDDRQVDEMSIKGMIKSIIPNAVINAIVFVKPVWMGFYHIGASLAIIGVLLIWPPLEFYWSEYELKIRTPIVLGRN
ncbi:MAG: aryl-sulfate sulfotransferase [Haloplanus sp.]